MVAKECDLSSEDLDSLNSIGIPIDIFDKMVENVIGIMPVPFGIATNFIVNGTEVLVTMAIEEPSVVAAASNAAKMARKHGGFTVTNTGSIMVAQIQVVNVVDANGARMLVHEHADELLETANRCDPILVKYGGGARAIRTRLVDTRSGTMIIVEIEVDCLDAMGANAVNTMAETLAPRIEEITGGRVFLRILTNLADKRLVRVRAVFDKEDLGGEEVVDGIVTAWEFAEADPYRAATHRKGIMNGITAVVLATGNDTRAVEAGMHSYAHTHPDRLPISFYEKNKDGNLVASMELPLAVGIIGGATKVHPTARTALKIMEIKGAHQLAEIMASVGLAQNFAALRALATEGIQRGHMGLHARNVAASVGAEGEMLDRIVEIMVDEKKVRMDRAQELLDEFTSSE